ncbi:MAG: rod shape-determining protein [Anaerococcus sp.]|nr:rod shape-determining protein [Anaerococcus sp.]
MNFRMIAKDFAMDLGTSNILLYKKNEGILANEPSFLLLDENNTKVLSVGEPARDMLGKTHDKVHIVKPIENGVITDFNLTEALLNYFFKKVNPGFCVIQPRVILAVPSQITDIQARACEDAALHAGAREVILVDQNLAGAYGMDLSPDEPVGRLMVNLGGGVSEVAVLALNGIITSKSMKKGGEYIDSLIIDYIRENLSLEIGLNMACEIKEKILSLRVRDKALMMKVDGRDLETAMPKTVELTSGAIKEVVIDYADLLANMIIEVLEKTPPEISKDIKTSGIFMTGNLAKLKGLGEYLSTKIGLKVNISDNPDEDVIKGCGIILEDPDRYTRYSK